jgi:hypothetical protein
MDRNGALSIEEWRPRWPPLWVHSTNRLGDIIVDTPSQKAAGPDRKNLKPSP